MSNLEESVKDLQKQVKTLNSIMKELIPTNVNNKDGIPIGMNLFGHTEDVGTIVIEALSRNYLVKKIGNQEITNGKKFNSLSAAAEAFSQIRRKSGWIFWKNSNGKTLKDVFKG